MTRISTWHFLRLPIPACDSKSEFSCSFGVCVPLSSVCDGVADCALGQDEVGCCDRQKEYRCSSDKACIDKDSVCDGVADCSGGEDEAGCPERCGPAEFRCPDGSKCILNDNVCDGVWDCRDGSDERMERCGERWEVVYSHSTCPTNNALLINFRLSSDAEILLTSTD